MIRILIATRIRSKSLLAAFGKSSASKSFRPYAAWDICSPHLTHVDGMRANSLALRLFLSATAWAVIILLITGVVLSSLYRAAVERAFDRRLGGYLRTLVADVATPVANAGKFPQSIGEPLFDLPLSGWYCQAPRVDGPTADVTGSRSRWDAALPPPGSLWR